MLQYLVILLDDTSTSFCHYEVNKAERKLISLDDLRAGIRHAMIENLTVQFVYPNYDLPQEYKDVINTIDHSDIVPFNKGVADADIVVLSDWTAWNVNDIKDKVVALRSTMSQLLSQAETIKTILETVKRLNVVITDVEKFAENQQDAYNTWLAAVGEGLEKLYVNGKTPQFNLITDRMMLTAMNNCGAGDTCVTLAPNGKFYVCPAFYYDNPADNVGDLISGIDIKNKQLYKLDHAPICRECDAWHCRRCIWLNRKMTLDVNTPSHEQCVMAHLERNASRDIFINLHCQGTFMPENPEIPEIDYLDPFYKVIKRAY